MKSIYRTDSFGNSLHTLVFETKTPRGVIQIGHGVNEHARRYIEFATFMVQHNYHVVIHDYVSQGESRTSEDNDVVYFTDQGVDVLVDGIHTIKSYIKEQYPSLPIYFVGHSLGSMIIRKALIDGENDYQKVILNGGGLSSTKGLNIAIFIASFLQLFGKKKPSRFFDNMFRSTQLKLNEKTEINHFIEWLTRDKEKNELDKKDPYLFIRLSVSAFKDMLVLMKYVNQKKHLKSMKFDGPFLLLSGTHDPATNFGEDTKNLHNIFKEYGVRSDIILYEEGRHDTFQETNRIKVYHDVLAFIREEKHD